MNLEMRTMMYMDADHRASGGSADLRGEPQKEMNWINKRHPPLQTLLAPVRNLYTDGRFVFKIRTLETESRRLNPQFQAWELVRRHRAAEVIKPSKDCPPSGFEGYYYGLGWSDEAMMHDLSRLVHGIQSSIKQTYRGAIISLDTMLGLLNGTTFDPQLLIVLTEHYGFALQRMKHELGEIRAKTPGAERKFTDFRADTYAAISGLPNITHSIEHYSVGVPFPPSLSLIKRPDPNTLPTDLQIIEGVGRLGEPLFKQVAGHFPLGLYGPIRTNLRAGYQPDGGFPDCFRNSPWD